MILAEPFLAKVKHYFGLCNYCNKTFLTFSFELRCLHESHASKKHRHSAPANPLLRRDSHIAITVRVPMIINDCSRRDIDN